jgi:nicotinamide riboside kinase
VLTRDDIPFVQDGLRDGEHLRAWMTQRFREVLQAQSAPVIEVHGSVDDRVRQVLARLDCLTDRIGRDPDRATAVSARSAAR